MFIDPWDLYCYSSITALNLTNTMYIRDITCILTSDNLTDICRRNCNCISALSQSLFCSSIVLAYSRTTDCISCFLDVSWEDVRDTFVDTFFAPLCLGMDSHFLHVIPGQTRIFAASDFNIIRKYVWQYLCIYSLGATCSSMFII